MGLVCVREDNPLSGVLRSVRLEEEDENDQNKQSERDLIVRLRYLLCPFEREVGNIS